MRRCSESIAFMRTSQLHRHQLSAGMCKIPQPVMSTKSDLTDTMQNPAKPFAKSELANATQNPTRQTLEKAKAWQSYADANCSNWLAPPRSWQLCSQRQQMEMRWNLTLAGIIIVCRKFFFATSMHNPRAANDGRKMTKDCAAAQKALLLRDISQLHRH